MKVRIKRNEFFGMVRNKFLKGKEIFFERGSYSVNVYEYLPEEIELEISESDIVKEKSNCEKWEEVFMKIGDMETIEMVESWSKDKADLFDLNGIDATQAYEKIVEGKYESQAEN